MSLPQSNARLLEVREQAAGENYDHGPTEGPAKLAGGPGIACYYREKRRRVAGREGGHSLIVERSLIVETAKPAIEWAEGDVVTVAIAARPGRTETIKATVSDVERASLAGVTATTRITFAPA